MGIQEAAALLAAFLWTIGTLIYGKVDLTAWQINLSKNTIATICLIVHLSIAGWLTSTLPMQLGWWSWVCLGLSGFVGIVIGDTFYFRCLQILGARRALVLATTSPVFAVFSGYWILGEALSWAALSLIPLVVIGLVVVILDRKSDREAPGLFPGSLKVGVLAGVGSAICQAIGLAFSKIAMNADCSPLEASLGRIGIALLCAATISLSRGTLVESYRKVLKWQQIRFVVPAAMMGAYIGIWLSQIAIEGNQIGIAQTLLSTSPLFAIPVVWIVLKQKPTSQAVVGTLIAVAGIVGLVFADDIEGWLR